MKHRDLIDRIEDAADAARTALIEGDDLDALAAAHLVNNYATQLTRALYDGQANAAIGRCEHGALAAYCTDEACAQAGA